ncbi:MAG: serine protease [Myxococcota bacterium]
MRASSRNWRGVAAPVCLFAGLASACTSPSDEASDVATQRQDIVGGQATASLPAVGALVRFGSPSCTGTVIAPRKVLTAAHCLDGVSAQSLSFVIGARVDRAEAVIGVRRIVPHPNYNRRTIANDIGYIELDRDAPVAPLPLIPALDQSFVGRDLIHVGYGATSGRGGGSGIKRFVNIPMTALSSTTYRYSAPGRNTCSGDSGGPALAQVGDQLFVTGVTSYGDARCTQFGVNTRVDTYTDFLDIAPNACGTETFEGRCNGNAVVWCEDNRVLTTDCTARQQQCSFSSGEGFFGCVEPSPADPCGGESFQGRCAGNTVVYCDDDEVKSISCPRQCGFDSGNGFFNCL